MEVAMPVSSRFGAMALTLAMVAAGCASRPDAETEAAKAAVDRAVSQDAARYASASLQSAQDARAALDAELKAQDAKWVKSYDKAKELAVAAKTAGDKAAADAVEGKERAEAESRKRVNTAAPRPAAKVTAPLRIGGQIKPPTRVKDVKPIYPAIAQSANVTGAVTIEATIGVDGKVADAKVVRSIPLLDQAALDAVRQWEYMPTLLNGVPVPVVTMVTVNFTR
jgi:TonB family protein